PLRRNPLAGHVLLLETLAKLLPGHAAGALVQPVVQLVLQVGPCLLSLVRVAGAGGLTAALARGRVGPLEHERVAVRKPPLPDGDTFLFHCGSSLSIKGWLPWPV